MTTDDRLATLERQMAEVRAALFLDDKGLVGDLIGPGSRVRFGRPSDQTDWQGSFGLCRWSADGLRCTSPGVAYVMEGDERTGGMVCEQHILPATLAGYGIDRTVRRTR